VGRGGGGGQGINTFIADFTIDVISRAKRRPSLERLYRGTCLMRIIEAARGCVGINHKNNHSVSVTVPARAFISLRSRISALSSRTK